jgi:5-methylcytosine-specific restriction endonuclease McrA
MARNPECSRLEYRKLEYRKLEYRKLPDNTIRRDRVPHLPHQTVSFRRVQSLVEAIVCLATQRSSNRSDRRTTIN